MVLSFNLYSHVEDGAPEISRLTRERRHGAERTEGQTKENV